MERKSGMVKEMYGYEGTGGRAGRWIETLRARNASGPSAGETIPCGFSAFVAWQTAVSKRIQFRPDRRPKGSNIAIGHASN